MLSTLLQMIYENPTAIDIFLALLKHGFARSVSLLHFVMSLSLVEAILSCTSSPLHELRFATLRCAGTSNTSVVNPLFGLDERRLLAYPKTDSMMSEHMLCTSSSDSRRDSSCLK